MRDGPVGWTKRSRATRIRRAAAAAGPFLARPFDCGGIVRVSEHSSPSRRSPRAPLGGLCGAIIMGLTSFFGGGCDNSAHAAAAELPKPQVELPADKDAKAG